MRLARKLGMITYRSAQEWEQRFGRERVSGERQSGDGFGDGFRSRILSRAPRAEIHRRSSMRTVTLYLSRASDLFDLAEHGGSIAAAMRRIRTDRVLVIGVETDFLFPIYQQQELVSQMREAGLRASLVELDSIQGHDSFLVDMDRFRPVVCEFFAGDWQSLERRCSAF
jgi:homoserine O-acetyltransferase